MANNSIINLFKEKTGISEKEWERLCRRYYTRDMTTFVNIISNICGKSSKAVKAELETELKAQNKVKTL